MALPDANKEENTREPNTPGTIEHTVARLIRWAQNAPRGLARVEYESEDTRRATIERLAEQCRALGIPMVSVDMPLRWSPERIVQNLLEHFESLPIADGLVTISGLTTAFKGDIPLDRALSILSASRDRLANFPYCQIWWMTPELTNVFLRAIPDMNSWFVVRLHLTEQVALPSDHISGLIDSAKNKKLIRIDEARRNANYLFLRAKVDISRGNFYGSLFFARDAVKQLYEAGARQESAMLADSALQLLAIAFLPDANGANICSDDISDQKYWINKIESLNNSWHAIVIYFALAALHHVMGNSNAALFFYQHILAIERSGTQIPFATRCRIYANLAMLLTERGEPARARELLQPIIASITPELISSYPEDAMQVFVDFGVALCKLREIDEAIALLERAQEIGRQYLQSNPEGFVPILNTLAMAYRDKGRLIESDALLQEAIETELNSIGEDSPHLGMLLHNQASVLKRMGRTDEADEVERRAEALGHQ